MPTTYLIIAILLFLDLASLIWITLHPTENNGTARGSIRCVKILLPIQALEMRDCQAWAAISIFPTAFAGGRRNQTNWAPTGCSPTGVLQ
jgi:hypothetical protein